ncbi:MAG: hypothetical protein ABL958_05870 [Bdellovibrionia bacterium]
MTQAPPRKPGTHLRELASEPCPRCKGVYEKGAAECGSCGLIFAKMKKPGEQVGIAAPANLEAEWSALIQNYADEAAHLAFIEKAITSKNVLFASQKYRGLIEANPSDEIAVKMRDKIIQKVSAIYMTRIPSSEDVQPSGMRKFVFILMGLGLSIALVGLMMPGSTGRVIAFVGAGAFAISIGIWAWMSQNG